MKWYGLCGIVAAAVAPVAAEAASAMPADFAARAEAVVNAVFPADGPGAAVIVTRRGQTVYASGRGLADVERGRAITPDTIFRLGSITKQFTAAVILQLVQEGRISLDDPLTRFFPDYPRPAGEATVRQLLNHTSGIRPFDAWTEETNRPHSTAEMIERFRDLPPRTPPGQAWAYNNSGYVLLAAIVEKETGRSWHEAIEERIVRPLGLRTIGHDPGSVTEAETARGYTLSGETLRSAPPLHILHGGGGLWGSVRDLARWTDALHHGRVVDRSLLEQMTSPAMLTEGRTHPYGFGLELEEIAGRQAIGHGARVLGFVGKTLYIPSEDLFVAVLVNSSSPPAGSSGIAQRLAALALGEPL